MSAKADARRSKACQSASFTLPSSHRGNLVPHQGGVAAMSGTFNSREEKSVLRAGMFMQARLKKRDRKQCTESWGGVPDLRDQCGSGKVSLPERWN